MKGFKFKLEAILKVRKLKEEQCKMDIGRIQARINQLNQFISEHEAGIEQSYQAQEQALNTGLNGTELQFHPYFVSGKRAHIDQIKSEIAMLTEEINELYDELKVHRANVKVISEMKDKQKKKYKKELQKKQFAQIEEQVQNWKQILK